MFESWEKESEEFDFYRRCSGEASVDEPIFVKLVQFLKILERHTTLLRAGTLHHPFVHHFRTRSQVNCGYNSTLLIKKCSTMFCYLPIKSAWIWMFAWINSYHSCKILYIPWCKLPLANMFSTKQYLQTIIIETNCVTEMYRKNYCFPTKNASNDFELIFSIAFIATCLVNKTDSVL